MDETEKKTKKELLEMLHSKNKIEVEVGKKKRY